MPNFSLCQKDPLVDHIRQQLGCNPVLKPSTRLRPLDLLLVNGGRTERLGPIEGYLMEDFNVPESAFERDTLVAFSGKDTSKVSLNFGLQLLTRLVGADPAEEDQLKTHFSGREQMALRFDHAQVIGAPLSLLREELRNNRVDVADPVYTTRNLWGNPVNQFYVVSRIVTSNKFSIKIFRQGQFNVSPKLEADFAGLQLKVANSDDVSLLLEHNTAENLTFAFACHRIVIGEKGNLFPLIETGKVPTLIFGASGKSGGGPVLLTDDPALVEIV